MDRKSPMWPFTGVAGITVEAVALALVIRCPTKRHTQIMFSVAPQSVLVFGFGWQAASENSEGDLEILALINLPFRINPDQTTRFQTDQVVLECARIVP